MTPVAAGAELCRKCGRGGRLEVVRRADSARCASQRRHVALPRVRNTHRRSTETLVVEVHDGTQRWSGSRIVRASHDEHGDHCDRVRLRQPVGLAVGESDEEPRGTF